MQTSGDIIDALGGITAAARLLCLTPSTVQGWKSANFIPEWRRPAVKKLAKKLGKPLSDEDFPTIEQRISRPQERAA